MGRITMAVLLGAAILGGQAAKAVDAPDQLMNSVVQTERDFAQAARAKGWRAAFLDYFSDDAIAFTPDPGPAKPRLKSQPVRPFEIEELTWEPRTGDVSSSGDLAWLTGPSTFIDHERKSPPSYGNYLTIWKREKDGRWTAFIDVGMGTARAVEFAPGFNRTPMPDRYAGDPNKELSTTRLLEADRALNAAIAAQGATAAYGAVAAPAARLHRPGSNAMPAVGKDDITKYLTEHADKMAATTAKGESSLAGDFGYTYGTYTMNAQEAHGSYVRIWGRDSAGRWLLQAEAVAPPRRPAQ